MTAAARDAEGAGERRAPARRPSRSRTRCARWTRSGGRRGRRRHGRLAGAEEERAPRGRAGPWARAWTPSLRMGVRARDGLVLRGSPGYLPQRALETGPDKKRTARRFRNVRALVLSRRPAVCSALCGARWSDFPRLGPWSRSPSESCCLRRLGRARVRRYDVHRLREGDDASRRSGWRVAHEASVPTVGPATTVKASAVAGSSRGDPRPPQTRMSHVPRGEAELHAQKASIEKAGGSPCAS